MAGYRSPDKFLTAPQPGQQPPQQPNPLVQVETDQAAVGACAEGQGTAVPGAGRGSRTRR